jgi:hypothetical protein
MSNNWMRHWQVQGTSKKTYKVSQRENGDSGCECPAWKFQRGTRKPCQHVLQIQLQLQEPKKVVVNTKKYENESVVRAISFED